MSEQNIYRVTEGKPLITPHDMFSLLPSSNKHLQQRIQNILAIEKILHREDDRKLLVVGPCSIHEEEASFEYAKKLKHLSEKVSDKFLIVMRAYFEKPRTVVGWKGMISDVDLNDGCDFNEGYKKARKILLSIADIGLPTACEIIHPITSLYLYDLLSWVCIGARTVESQIHREFASGLSSPVGFKNSTSGDVSTAINAMQSVKRPHTYIGCDEHAKLCHLHSNGNEATHLILRGGASGANYHAEAVHAASETMKSRGLIPNIMVDCCHSNSEKQPSRVPAIFEDVVGQITDGNSDIIGIMLESFLIEGRQDIPQDLSRLVYGQSVTDPCVSWETTENLIMTAYDKLASK